MHSSASICSFYVVSRGLKSNLSLSFQQFIQSFHWFRLRRPWIIVSRSRTNPSGRFDRRRERKQSFRIIFCSPLSCNRLICLPCEPYRPVFWLFPFLIELTLIELFHLSSTVKTFIYISFYSGFCLTLLTTRFKRWCLHLNSFFAPIAHFPSSFSFSQI